MKISVALATYNGAKHLQQQLDSYLTQTRLPDELVVTDDCSKDETVNIIKKFAKTSTFEVKYFSNRKTLGYAENFSNTIARCSGDVIFISDQDDVWFKNKIEVVCNSFEQDDSILVVSNNAELTDESLNPSGVTILDNVKSIGLSNYLVHGCCAAFKSSLVPIYLPVPDYVTHDWWLHYIGINLETKTIIKRPLQFYRRHNKVESDTILNSTKKVARWRYFIGVLTNKERKHDAVSTMNQRITELKILQCRMRDSLIFRKQYPSISAVSRQKLPLKIKANESRKMLLSRPIILRLISAIHLYLRGGYKYSSGLRGFVKDVL